MQTSCSTGILPDKESRFENLLFNIATRLGSLPIEEIDAHIEAAQGEICQVLKVDVSALWQWSDKQSDLFTITHLHSPPTGPDRPVDIDASVSFPWVFDKMRAGELLVLRTEELAEEAKVDKESRRFFGITSSVCIPLLGEKRLMLGTLTFDKLVDDREWTDIEIQRLTILADIFSNALMRKRAETELRISNQRLELAAESAGAGLWELDITNGVYWATEQARALFNFPAKQIVTQEAFEQKIYRDDLALVQQAIAQAIEDGQPFRVEYRAEPVCGSLRWICSKGKTSYHPDGTPAKLLGVSMDMTERKVLEQQLQSQLDEVDRLKQQLVQENISLREELGNQRARKKVIGTSNSFQKVMKAAQQVAPTDATVLLLGETGTGKGVLADAIHTMSRRQKAPLVVVNCATLPSELIESELFGRERGAFTGASSQQMGRFELADNGTIFLDEIGELPLELQAKLLRILQDEEFERLGNPRSIKVNVRVIAATGRNLLEKVREGTFREDLYYRLNVFPILLPPLRERRSDIPLFAKHFIEKYSAKMQKKVCEVERRSLERLVNYPWPGNIRELEHLIERSLILNSDPVLRLDEQLVPQEPQPLKVVNGGQNLQSMERNHILSVLEETGWRIQGDGGAAVRLDINPSTLRFKMKKLNIQRPT